MEIEREDKNVRIEDERSHRKRRYISMAAVALAVLFIVTYSFSASGKDFLYSTWDHLVQVGQQEEVTMENIEELLAEQGISLEELDLEYSIQFRKDFGLQYDLNHIYYSIIHFQGAEHHGYSYLFLSEEELLQIERIWMIQVEDGDKVSAYAERNIPANIFGRVYIHPENRKTFVIGLTDLTEKERYYEELKELVAEDVSIEIIQLKYTLQELQELLEKILNEVIPETDQTMKDKYYRSMGLPIVENRLHIGLLELNEEYMEQILSYLTEYEQGMVVFVETETQEYRD